MTRLKGCLGSVCAPLILGLVLALVSSVACSTEASHSGSDNAPHDPKPTAAPQPSPTPVQPPTLATECPVTDRAACDTALAAARGLAAGSTTGLMAIARSHEIGCPANESGPGPFPVCAGAAGTRRAGYSVGKFAGGGAFLSQGDFEQFLQRTAHTEEKPRPEYSVAAIGCAVSADTTSTCSRLFAVTVHLSASGADAGALVLVFVRDAPGSPASLIAAYNWASGTPEVDGGMDSLGDLWTGEHMSFAFSRWNVAAS